MLIQFKLVFLKTTYFVSADYTDNSNHNKIFTAGSVYVCTTSYFMAGQKRL